TAILQVNADDMTTDVPAGSALVEFGSGSSQKTEILLQAMPDLYAYVPIDVSPSALDEAGARLKGRFPELNIHPICADFSKPTNLPETLRARPKVGFFPGSTIGNFQRGEAQALLDTFRVDLQPGGRLVVGVDLVKDRSVLHLAYDDRAGVTADFNLNILARINRAFGATLDLDAFSHEARFNEAKSRIEMHLVSNREQIIEVLGQRFSMHAGETIHTENSHKYTIAGFGELAATAGWRTDNVWTDEDSLFSVHELISD
ncbi:MAG: L-histidine N(alpha)-methyltransferase, partial [Rhizobiales bacterium]|nr:L-histidine N(alpha)-methyltransferase [Hyphomicrobiales bacterium]